MQFLDETDPRRLIWEKCESPIEQLLCTALFAFLGLDAVVGDYTAGRLISLAAPCDRPTGFLFAQHPIGRYRLDFLVVAIDPTKRRARLLGLECDGKAYHGTPEQLDYDRVRERQIRQDAGPGFTIRRYSGGELRGAGIRRAIADVTQWLGLCDIAPSEGPGAWFTTMFTPGKPDLRTPYRDEAAEDEEFRRQFQREGFV